MANQDTSSHQALEKLKAQLKISTVEVGKISIEKSIFSILEEENLKKDRLKEENRELELRNVDREQNIKLRKKYAYRIFVMVCIWLFIILTITCFQAIGCFHLSDAVLITLISTTTANVAAYFLGVIRYLFPKK